MGEDLLFEYANKYGVTLTNSNVEKFSLFLDFLEEWNSKMNLVGTSDRDRIITELVLDSIIPVPYLPSAGNMVDIGSGAGFPGLMIKIMKPGIHVKLIESAGKKVSFLKYVIRALQLKNIIVAHERFETMADFLKDGEISLITSRAMTGLNNLIKSCVSFLHSGGTLICFLGSKWKKELKENESLLEESHLFIDNLMKYKLPEKSTERAVVFLKKYCN